MKEITPAEFGRRGRFYGYVVRRVKWPSDDGPLKIRLEAYPEGLRGRVLLIRPATPEGMLSMIEAIRAERVERFQQILGGMGLDETSRDALVKWFDHHGAGWLQALHRAWYSGRYDGDSLHRYASALQRLRNGNGHDVVEKIRQAELKLVEEHRKTRLREGLRAS